MIDAALERDVIALFEAWLEAPPAHRPALLRDRTAGRPDLRARFEAMRAADETASLRTGAAVDEVEEPATPERIGAYRIVERIGRGGMGSVYRGERATGDFGHAVAIKIIKPGLLSETLVERFGRERQILAQLSHPNIARLYDGGETETGSPYIIMELVDGSPVLQWAEDRALNRAGRGEVFRDICGAVAFAHRNLIVHRDLTPSNVLVTRDGTVKLIDFGIARPADDQGATRQAAPSVASLSLTAGYAAPERMTNAEVTTAADIFSLGRVLENLFRPEPRERELRAIVARATAPRPEDRYATVEALAADVDAWRRGSPVAAAGGGRSYVARKFVARHRTAVAASAGGLALLVGALALATGAYAQAERARRAEAARFEELRSLARFMVFDLNDRLVRVAGNTRARATVADRAQVYLTGLAGSAEADPSLRLEAARGLIALAHVQGVPGQPNLGDAERARANLQAALTMLEEGEPAEGGPERVEALTALAMISAHKDTDLKSAAARLSQADAVLAGASPDRGPALLEARRKLRIAELEMATLEQKPADLLRLSAQLEREIAQWPAAMRRTRDAEVGLAYADYYRGIHGYMTDALEPAVVSAQTAERRLLALDRRSPNDPVTLYAIAWNSYVGYGAASGLPARQAEAIRFLELARVTLERLLAMEENDADLRSFAANVRQAQAQAASAAGRFAEAVAAQTEVLDLRRAAVRLDRPPQALNRLAISEVTMGGIALQARDRSLACGSFARARALMAELEKRNELLGFVSSRRGAMESNLRLCASNGPLAAMTGYD